MALTLQGALKIAAKKCGTSLDIYLEKIKSGQKWCTGCKAWHSIESFAKDASRSDGRHPVCKDYGNSRGRRKYLPVPSEHRKPHGPTPLAERDGDIIQARQKVNQLVKSGKLPRPNDLPCVDCGHIYQPGGMRHEYDHYLGYAVGNHTKVQAVCSACHHLRHPKERSTRNGNFHTN